MRVFVCLCSLVTITTDKAVLNSTQFTIDDSKYGNIYNTDNRITTYKCLYLLLSSTICF